MTSPAARYPAPSAAQRRLMLRPAVPPDFFDPRLEWRRLFAESWGTFLLVLVAAGGSAVAAFTGTHVSPTALAAAPGIMVMVVIYFMGTVSGAHLNPAVTLAFAVRRNFPWMRVPGYIVAQLAGGLIAAALLRTIFGTAAAVGATIPGPNVTAVRALVMETLLTAGLVNTILGTAAGARNIGPNGAIAVGGYIALAGMWASAVSGASMNPARSLSPDVVRGDFATSWVYIIGPLAGAMIGVGFEWLLKGPATASGTLAAQGTLGVDDEGA